MRISFQSRGCVALACIILTSEGQIMFLQNYSHVFGSHLSHEHSRVEIFSFGEKVNFLPFILWENLMIHLLKQTCLRVNWSHSSVFLLWSQWVFLSSFFTYKYSVVLGFGRALPIFKGEQQERHKKKDTLYFFPLRKQCLKLHVICGLGKSRCVLTSTKQHCRNRIQGGKWWGQLIPQTILSLELLLFLFEGPSWLLCGWQ